MALHLVYHLEDSRYVGIWPSEVEAISELAKTMGVSKVWIVDCTMDGFFQLPNHVPHQRVSSLDQVEWTAHVVAFETPQVKLGVEPVDLELHDDLDLLDEDVTYVFGPHNGLHGLSPTHHVYLDYGGGHIPVRDALTIALARRWRV